MTNDITAKRFETIVSQTKQKLINKVSKRGLYENFGQKEVGELKDKYIDSSSYSDNSNAKRAILSSFDDWAMRYKRLK
ncbi:MAG: hypothetical protein RBR50_01020 [Candidatus Izemoplasmatales bacterium]|nr:hypothetical protein [Candidatus Izemoplasmatales bacterium]